MIHIHAPQPTSTEPANKHITADKAEKDRFGRLLIIPDCCRKKRVLDNCEISFYEWYESYLSCKPGKGCKRHERI